MPVSNETILSKILDSEPNTYVIFFKNECPYCMGALDKLRESKLKFKGYNINNIHDGNLDKLLEIFKKYKNQIGFDPIHETIPIIFYNKKFIGGSDKLFIHINNNNDK